MGFRLDHLLSYSLDGLNVAGGRSFLTLFHFKRYLLALCKGLKTGADDSAVVDKNIFTAILSGDKAITFGIVEPFHGACNHGSTSLLIGCKVAAGFLA